jgi:hypothetical protein
MLDQFRLEDRNIVVKDVLFRNLAFNLDTYLNANVSQNRNLGAGVS